MRNEIKKLREFLIRMIEQGLPDNEIAKFVPVELVGILWDSPEDKKYHPEKRKQMLRLFARGLSYRKISKTLNVSLRNVQYWSKKISKEEIEIERSKIKAEQQQKIENYWLEQERLLKAGHFKKG